jgi:oligopeptide transport system permease protein
MSAILSNPPAASAQESPGLWALAWRRLRHDRVGMVSLVIVAFFLLLMIASYAGLIASDWNKEVGVSYANPSFMAGAQNLEAQAIEQRKAAARCRSSWASRARSSPP